MKTIRYVPKCAKGEDAKFSGYIELRLPLYEEKLEYMEQCGLGLDDEGGVAQVGGQSNVTVLRNMMKCARAHYVAVALDQVDPPVEYRSYEDLSCDPDTSVIAIEIATAIFRGLKVGND